MTNSKKVKKYNWFPGDIEIDAKGKDWKDEGEKDKEKSKRPTTHVHGGYEGIDWDSILR